MCAGNLYPALKAQKRPPRPAEGCGCRLWKGTWCEQKSEMSWCEMGAQTVGSNSPVGTCCPSFDWQPLELPKSFWVFGFVFSAASELESF